MIRVGLVGCGNIGSFIARYLDNSDEYRLMLVFDINRKKAETLVHSLKQKPRVVRTVREVVKKVDLVVEAASQGFVHEHAVEVVKEGKSLLVMSVGAFADYKLLRRIKQEVGRNRGFVYIPSGALGGVDAVKSACMDEVSHVVLTTTKPPKAFEGVAYLKKRKINLNNITKPRVLYSGPASEAARLFPKNINVSTVLSLAGIGLDKTSVRIVADPQVKDNTHEVKLTGKCGLIYIRLDNKPSPLNPKTSYLACLSAVRMLKDIPNRIIIGN